MKKHNCLLGLMQAMEELELYLIQEAEDRVIVYQARDVLDWGPSGPPEVHLAELRKGYLVHGEDLRYVAFPAMR